MVKLCTCNTSNMRSNSNKKIVVVDITTEIINSKSPFFLVRMREDVEVPVKTLAKNHEIRADTIIVHM